MPRHARKERSRLCGIRCHCRSRLLLRMERMCSASSVCRADAAIAKQLPNAESASNCFSLLANRSHPGYFGKVGMRQFHLLRNRKHNPVINTDKLWSLVGDDVFAKAQKDSSSAPVIDVVANGYFKVLGKGVLPKVALIVKAKNFTVLAEKKIKEAGGACVLSA